MRRFLLAAVVILCGVTTAVAIPEAEITLEKLVTMSEGELANVDIAAPVGPVEVLWPPRTSTHSCSFGGENMPQCCAAALKFSMNESDEAMRRR